MKKFKTHYIIIAGLLAAGFLSTTNSKASTLDTRDLEFKDAYCTEALDAVMNDEEMEMIESITQNDHCCKIYNSQNELVYMSKDKNDERMLELKKRSDLIMKTDYSSYYLLGD